MQWLYLSRDFQLMQQHLEHPGTELSQKELLYAYLMKNYKEESSHSSVKADVSSNGKLHSILKMFTTLYPEGEEEARQFTEAISQDQIMISFADSVHFTQYMKRIHTLFLDNYDLKAIKKDQAKYYLLFLQCNL